MELCSFDTCPGKLYSLLLSIFTVTITNKGTRAEAEDAHGNRISSVELEALYMQVRGQSANVAFGTNYLYIGVLRMIPNEFSLELARKVLQERQGMCFRSVNCPISEKLSEQL